MGKRSSFERRPADFYPTPRAAVLPLIPSSAASEPLPNPAPAKATWSGIWNPSACVASMPETSRLARMRWRSTPTACAIRSLRIHPGRATCCTG